MRRWVAYREGYLSFGVRSSPSQLATPTQLGELGIEFVREDDSQGHTLFSLVSGVAEHQTLGESDDNNNDTGTKQ